jgi:hypothetical protein
MNGPAQIHYRELLFFRSCLESSPARVERRPSSTLGATRPSDRTHSQLHQLKRKLLRVALEETPETRLFKRLCGAANQAAELAWATAMRISPESDEQALTPQNLVRHITLFSLRGLVNGANQRKTP